MKQIILILTILFFTSEVLSQNAWEKMEIDLWKQFKNKEITLQEFGVKMKEEAVLAVHFRPGMKLPILLNQHLKKKESNYILLKI